MTAPPREPTPEMMRAGDKAWGEADHNDYVQMCGEIWLAMYDAAPSAAPPATDDLAVRLRRLAAGWGDSPVTQANLDAADLIEHQARELAASNLECVKLRGWVNDAEQAAGKLQRELAAARADAERYRWLRDTLSRAVGGGVEVNDSALVYETPINGEQVRVYWYPYAPIGFYESKGATLDAAIDAAKGAK